jgi:hypothetical protein
MKIIMDLLEGIEAIESSDEAVSEGGEAAGGAEAVVVFIDVEETPTPATEWDTYCLNALDGSTSSMNSSTVEEITMFVYMIYSF